MEEDARNKMVLGERQKLDARYLVTALYAPVLYGIRYRMRKNPPLRNALWMGVVATAAAHLGTLMYFDFQKESEKSEVILEKS